MSNSLVPVIMNTDITKAWTDATYASLKVADPLGFSYQSSILTKQAEALTDPKKYITDRNTKITDAQAEVYKNWVSNYKKSLSTGTVDMLARQKADAIAMGEWQGNLSAIEAEFPLSALGVAVESQRDINLKDLGHTKNELKIGGNKAPSVKRPRKKRSSKKK